MEAEERLGRGRVDEGMTQEKMDRPGSQKALGTFEAWKMGWDYGKRQFIQGKAAELALESDPSSNLAT